MLLSMFRFRNTGVKRFTQHLGQRQSAKLLPQSLRFKYYEPKILTPTLFNLRSSRMMTYYRSQPFSSQATSSLQEPTTTMDDLEQEALNIQNSIDSAKINIEKNTRKGLDLSQRISREVEEDKFIKMQRYQIFISKMEQLARVEQRQKKEEKRALFKMQSAFMNSQKPLKDLLFYYNKAAVKGFDSSLVSKTLEQIKLTLRARGN